MVKKRNRRINSKIAMKKERLVRSIIVLGGVTFLIVIIVFSGIFAWKKLSGEKIAAYNKEITKRVEKPEIDEEFLTPNQYSRSQLSLKKVKGIVIHYTANPNSDAMDNRNYFENLKDTHTTSASSHFIIGLDGTIIQCIPLDEIAYASNDRNTDTISIECCHKKKSGEFTKKTYQSLVELVAWLCGEYNLQEEDIIRHYDVTGKNCPKYFVEHEDKWKKFKQEVFEYIEANANE